MEDVTLQWDKPMTSKQASKYYMTSGFVAVELYRTLKGENVKLLEDINRLLDRERDLCNRVRELQAALSDKMKDENNLKQAIEVVVERLRELYKADILGEIYIGDRALAIANNLTNFFRPIFFRKNFVHRIHFYSSSTLGAIIKVTTLSSVFSIILQG